MSDDELLTLARLEKEVRLSEGREFAASETVEEIRESLLLFKMHRKFSDAQWTLFIAERIADATRKLQSQRVRVAGALEEEDELKKKVAELVDQWQRQKQMRSRE